MKNGQRLIGAGQKIFMLFHCPLDGEQFKDINLESEWGFAIYSMIYTFL